MKTIIIILEGWETIQIYHEPIPLSKGDYLDYKGGEYRVEWVNLDVDEEEFLIAIKKIR